MPRFSILHTSARPDKWREIYDAWIAAADRPSEVEYVLVTDLRWGFTPEYMHTQVPFSSKIITTVVRNTGRRCYVEGVNLAAKHSTGDILIVIADDQYPCEHWDRELYSRTPLMDLQAGTCMPGKEFVLHVATGTPDEFARQITPMPIMSRALYEKWGYVFYPEYESVYADNDLCEHAKLDGVLIEARHLLFPHKHPACEAWDGKAPMAGIPETWDEAYKAQNNASAYQIGERVYRQRKAMNFGSVNTPTKAVRRNGKPSVQVMLPGETFSQEWVAAWTGTLAWLSGNFRLMEPMFGYASNPHITRAGMVNRMFELLGTNPQLGIPDYVLWIDDDNPVNPKHLAPLFQNLEDHPEIGVMAGWCWMHGRKEIAISAGQFYQDSDAVCPLDYDELMKGPHDICKVAWTGFPCVIMRTEILLKCKEPFGIIQSDIWPGFFGEDVAFCKHATDAGYMICIDRRVEVPHLKLRALPGPEKKTTSIDPVTPEAITIL